MSNLKDAVGLCLPYGKAESHFQTEFEPATGTIWGYFNPPGAPCFSLKLLKDIAAHDATLFAKAGAVEVDGQIFQPSHYVLASRSSACSSRPATAKRSRTMRACASTTCTGASATSAAPP